MKTPRLLLASLAALLAANLSSALTFIDVDVDGNEGEPHWQYMASWGFSNWSKSFDILSSGFDPLSMEVLSAVVYFAFADDESDSGEYVTMKVGDAEYWSGQEVDGTHYNGYSSYDWYSTNLGDTELEDLQDGSLDYEVTADSGDMYLKEAKLVVQTGPKSPPPPADIPDKGLTLLMLALGVGVLLVLKRQMADAIV